MLSGKRVLVVVPARGGSKGISLKNLRPFQGVPLVGVVGRLVSELDWVDRAVVSTDHEEIARVAEAYGLAAPFRRPEALAGDLIGDYDVLRHALLETESADGKRYDIVIMLQPTSPLRKASQVLAAARKLVDEGWDAVWTVSPTDLKYHPKKQLTVDAEGTMEYYEADGATIIARQQLRQTYHRNGAAYALTRDCLMVHGNIKGQRASAIVIDAPMVSIDTLDDLARAEAYGRRD